MTQYSNTGMVHSNSDYDNLINNIFYYSRKSAAGLIITGATTATRITTVLDCGTDTG